MYALHPITMNPFKTAFVDVFTSERDRARECADRGSTSDVEQLVWVVWKVLKGEGTDVSNLTNLFSYQPNLDLVSWGHIRR